MWQPIETAPKDGTAILLALREPLDGNDSSMWVPWGKTSVIIGWWDGLHYGWEIMLAREGAADSFGYSDHFWIDIPADGATHWMPLPHQPSHK